VEAENVIRQVIGRRLKGKEEDLLLVRYHIMIMNISALNVVMFIGVR